MNSILVACEGNICRSPMAAALLAKALPHSEVRSAGLNALSGMAADAAAIRLMHDRGIDITSHRALQLTSDLCRLADLVLVMSADQRTLVQQKYAFACGRVFRLCEFSKRDVPDPYRKPQAAFQEALRLIDIGVGEWLRRIDKIRLVEQ
jgi:protein-tyrosine phosphatase